MEISNFIYPVPKKYVPPFRVPKRSQPNTSFYSVGLYGLSKLGISKKITGPLRRIGRKVIPVGIIVIDGIHDWYLLIDCALECKDDGCN